jgi:hypothetical protein
MLEPPRRPRPSPSLDRAEKSRRRRPARRFLSAVYGLQVVTPGAMRCRMVVAQTAASLPSHTVSSKTCSSPSAWASTRAWVKHASAAHPSFDRSAKMAEYEKSLTTNTLFYGALDCTMASAQRPQTGQTAAGGGAEFSFGGRSA